MIHFSNSDWDRVRSSFEAWWEKKSPSALVGCMVDRFEPSGKKPEKPLISQNNVHLNFTADEILDGIEYELSRYEFIGDAFPMFSLDCFGPGIVAAFLGCNMNNNNGETGIWFQPERKLDISDFNPVYDGDNPVFRRLKELLRRAAERFEGRILVSMPDLGGVADILSSFFPGEELMYEMCDNPELVLSAIKKIDVLWQRYYDEFAAELKSKTYGYTDWAKTLSAKPSYTIQSDITYMLSHDMFREFVLDSVKTHSKNLDRVLFHLDGVGELKNLDDLLAIEGLDAVQWIPGSNGGRGGYSDWLEVYDKILGADKLAQVGWTNFEDFEKIVRHVNKKGYLQNFIAVYPGEQRDYAASYIEKIKSL